MLDCLAGVTVAAGTHQVNLVTPKNPDVVSGVVPAYRRYRTHRAQHDLGQLTATQMTPRGLDPIRQLECGVEDLLL
jgi:hypothetical protein